MYYLTLINETDHDVNLSETHEDKADAARRLYAYQLTAELNTRDTGKTWRAEIGDAPFEWPKPVEPS